MWENAFGNEEQRGEIIITLLTCQGAGFNVISRIYVEASFQRIQHDGMGARVPRIWTDDGDLREDVGVRQGVNDNRDLLGGADGGCHLHQSIYLTSSNMIMLRCHSGVYFHFC